MLFVQGVNRQLLPYLEKNKLHANITFSVWASKHYHRHRAVDGNVAYH